MPFGRCLQRGDSDAISSHNSAECASTRASSVRRWGAARRVATKCGQTELYPQCDEHAIEGPQFGLKGLHGPSMTPRPLQAASAIHPGQRIELGFQTLADLGLAGVQNSPEVFGLLQVSARWGNPHGRHPLPCGAQHKPQRQPLPHKSTIAPVALPKPHRSVR